MNVQNVNVKLTSMVIKKYFWLVKKVAKKYSNRRLPLDDLIIVGMGALLEAHRKYNPDKGASFETFATRYIKTRIFDELRKENQLIKFPLSYQRKIKRILKGNAQGLSEEEIDNELKIYKRRNTYSLSDKIVAPEEKSTDYSEAISKIFKYLNNKERNMLALYFGFELPGDYHTERIPKPKKPQIEEIIKKIRNFPEIMEFLRK